MYTTLKAVHSYWAYFVLLIMVIATINAIIKWLGKKEYQATDFRLSLFTLIVSHLQLLIGIIVWFAADYFSELSMGEIMKNATLRSNVVEHPLTMVIAVALITVGYSKHKKKLTSPNKFKTIAMFYSLALILVLAKIPWKVWFA